MVNKKTPVKLSKLDGINIQIEGLQKQLKSLQIENSMLHAVLRKRPEDLEVLQALEFVARAIKTGQFSDLALQMDKLSEVQIKKAHTLGDTQGGTRRAVANATLRLEKDKLSKAKNDAMLEIEKEWQALKVKPYGTKTKFAKDMQKKYPILESAVAIERRLTRFDERLMKSTLS